MKAKTHSFQSRVNLPHEVEIDPDLIKEPLKTLFNDHEIQVVYLLTDVLEYDDCYIEDFEGKFFLSDPKGNEFTAVTFTADYLDEGVELVDIVNEQVKVRTKEEAHYG